MNYSRVFGSQFPEQPVTIQEKVDVNDAIVAIVNSIETYIRNGDIANANKVYEENKDVLEPSVINASFVNLLQEDIYNVGVLAWSKQSNMITPEMPTTQDVAGGYWIQDYE